MRQLIMLIAVLAFGAMPNHLQAQAVSTREVGKLLESVMPTLEKTRVLLDRHPSLPDNSHVPLRADKRSNRADMNRLLDKAIDVLEVSSVSALRDEIREAQSTIRHTHNEIAEYRRKRIAAAEESSLSRLERVNPFVETKESIDEIIVEKQSEIVLLKKRQVELKSRFKKALNEIGLEIDDNAVESLLASISGDDFVSMAVAFENIKLLTRQLQQLTEESGEALDTAKRYYGMYVVMVEAMDRIQKNFVDRVKNVHIPKLREYSLQAEENIDQAERLISNQGGSEEVLKQNIESNRITLRAAQLYVEYLQEQADAVAKENLASERTLATAVNTYRTVKLSSDVASLIEAGRSEFDALMQLQIPPMQGFENDQIRNELQRMTQDLSGR